jgi:RNA polymerase sigma-70 factor (ECF subfamily)
VSGHVTEAVALAARTSYGRLVALLSARSHDVLAAEDALSDAFVRAIDTWPRDGIPANPDAWLVATAQRRLIDMRRRDAVRERAEPELAYAASLAARTDSSVGSLPDRRLELLFACAHPAIDPFIRTPLMLQCVLGLEADLIASAFLTAPSAMAQRLVRAKRKLRDAGVPFEIPEPHELSARLESVLEAIYGAFGSAWDMPDGGDAESTEARGADLRGEAIFLGRLVVDALPGEAEARGLLALMLYCDARRAARRDAHGAYVPLSQQRADMWDRAGIGEAESLLESAARLGRPGRFQIEAAIQSAHVGQAFGRAARPADIVTLYDALVVYSPTLAVFVNRAAAIAAARGPAEGLAHTMAIPPDAIASYQPWWALHAHLLQQLGDVDGAHRSRERAAGLTQDPAVRAFLLSPR